MNHESHYKVKTQVCLFYGDIISSLCLVPVITSQVQVLNSKPVVNGISDVLLNTDNPFSVQLLLITN